MLTAAHFCRIAGEKKKKKKQTKHYLKGRVEEKNSSAPKIIKKSRDRSDTTHTHSHCGVQKDFCLCSAFYLFLIWGRQNLVIKAIFYYYFFFPWLFWLKRRRRGRQKAFGDKLALMTDCVFYCAHFIRSSLFPPPVAAWRATPGRLMASHSAQDTKFSTMTSTRFKTLPDSHVSLLSPLLFPLKHQISAKFSSRCFFFFFFLDNLMHHEREGRDATWC